MNNIMTLPEVLFVRPITCYFSEIIRTGFDYALCWKLTYEFSSDFKCGAYRYSLHMKLKSKLINIPQLKMSHAHRHRHFYSKRFSVEIRMQN